jgi:hypothetical protein
MYMKRMMMALCFLLSGTLAGCTTSPLNIASPEIVVVLDGNHDSLEAGRGGSGLRAGRRGSGLRPGRGGSGLRPGTAGSGLEPGIDESDPAFGRGGSGLRR